MRDFIPEVGIVAAFLLRRKPEGSSHPLTPKEQTSQGEMAQAADALISTLACVATVTLYVMLVPLPC